MSDVVNKHFSARVAFCVVLSASACCVELSANVVIKVLTKKVFVFCALFSLITSPCHLFWIYVYLITVSTWSCYCFGNLYEFYKFYVSV